MSKGFSEKNGWDSREICKSASTGAAIGSSIGYLIGGPFGAAIGGAIGGTAGAFYEIYEQRQRASERWRMIEDERDDRGW